MTAKLLLLALMLVAQAPEPDYLPPGDPHAGQPRSCSNSPHIRAVKQDCACTKPKCDETAMEDRNCAVYCRKPACRCRHEHCETH